MDALLIEAANIITKFAMYDEIKGDHARQVVLWLGQYEARLDAAGSQRKPEGGQDANV